MERQYNHYFKTLPTTTVDVYRVLEAYEITDHAIAHAIKKLLAAGKRGAKDETKDVIEAIDSLLRKIQMLSEDGKIDLCHVTVKNFKLELIENEHPKIIPKTQASSDLNLTIPTQNITIHPPRTK